MTGSQNQSNESLSQLHNTTEHCYRIFSHQSKKKKHFLNGTYYSILKENMDLSTYPNDSTNPNTLNSISHTQYEKINM